MRKKARLIYNPVAGRGVIKNNLIDILNILERAGYETSTYPTTPSKKSAYNEAKRSVSDDENFDLIVAAGGDGTISEVVNGMMQTNNIPKLGIIPSGTTNDYARALHIPRSNPLKAAKVIAKDITLKIDVGHAYNKKESKYFINIAGGGYLTELTYGVSSNLKSMFGYLAYLAKGAEMLPNIKPIDIDIKYDDDEYKGKATMFLLALTNSIGGFEQIVPDAKLNDGHFTLLIVKTTNLVEILQLLAKIMNGGRHINDPRLVYKKTKFAEVKSLGKNFQINLDGEKGGYSPMDFEVLREHIRVCVNKKQ